MSCVTWHLLMLGRGLTAVSVCVYMSLLQHCVPSLSLPALGTTLQVKVRTENDLTLSPISGAM